MWYVIQVAGGREEETAALIQKQISPDVMRESFIPRKERIKKFRGRWRQVKEILFPGYVFTETEQPEALFLELKHVTRLTKLLQDGKSFFIPLSREEEEMIRSIGDEMHVTRVTRVKVEENIEKSSRRAGQIVETKGMWNVIGRKKEDKEENVVGRKVTVLTGPLKGHEGCVVRYYLHKREAIVRLPFMGQDTEIRMGIEIVGKG